jgi:hypothetical protein
MVSKTRKFFGWSLASSTQKKLSKCAWAYAVGSLYWSQSLYQFGKCLLVNHPPTPSHSAPSGPLCEFLGLRRSCLTSIMSTWSYSRSTPQNRLHATRTSFLKLPWPVVNYCLCLCSIYREGRSGLETVSYYYCSCWFLQGKVCSVSRANLGTFHDLWDWPGSARVSGFEQRSLLSCELAWLLVCVAPCARWLWLVC